jgi:hypothetical protein
VIWFRRRQQDEDGTGDVALEAPENEVDVVDEGSGDGSERGRAAERRAEQAAAESERAARGPLDVSEVEDDVTRIDLGALRIPPRQGMGLRLEIDEKTQRVIAANIQLEESTVQLQAFAAPRTEGIWDDIRTEIGAQITKQGGTADEVPGTFGREIIARIPARTPDGRTGHRVARFTGVDGPRWFLRAVFNGQAAVSEEAAADLEEVVRGIVVVRGSEAMAPRDLLPLKLPQGQSQPVDAEQEPAEDEDGLGPLDPLRRGPETTETR